MKKLVLLLVATTTLVACDNGIGENLEALTVKLAAINAELAASTSEMQVSISNIVVDLEAAQASVDEANQAIEDAISVIDDLNLRLDEAIAALAEAATEEQIIELAADVAAISEALVTLEEIGDFDYDGIINILDKCPGTEPGVEVGTDGCPLTD